MTLYYIAIGVLCAALMALDWAIHLIQCVNPKPLPSQPHQPKGTPC